MTAELDRDSPVPLYDQLAQILRDRISDGTYTSRMPGEWDLVEEFDVGRHTVRRAVRLLVAEGLLRISPGKGVYVQPEPEREA